jgi:hypothetical protein
MVIPLYIFACHLILPKKEAVVVNSLIAKIQPGQKLSLIAELPIKALKPLT